jgi:hypothetical protein
VVWLTDEPADSEVEYGPDTGYGSTSGVDPTLTTHHVVALSGLSSGQTIHYRVRSADVSGNPAVSEDKVFTVGEDTTAPVIGALSLDFGQSAATAQFATSEPTYGRFAWGTGLPLENLIMLASSTAPSPVHGVTLSGLSAGVEYLFEITVLDPAGNQAVFSDSFVFAPGDTVDTTPPQIPVGLRIIGFNESSGVVLEWSHNADVDLAGYRVYRRPCTQDAQPEPWTSLTTTPVGDAAFQDLDVDGEAVQVLEYTITAEDDSENESGYAQIVTFNPEYWAMQGITAQNFPNPFHLGDGTEILFQIPLALGTVPRHVDLSVYDVTGRRVRNLISGRLPTGRSHTVRWDGRDQRGIPVAAGVYFYRLDLGVEKPLHRKMVVIR